MNLIVTPNFEDADGFYSALLAAHKGLSASESEAFNARLVLILANQLGDKQLLAEALALAAK